MPEAGILIFSTGLGTKLPPVLNTFINGLAQTNAPVAMMVLGIYLARTKISALFTTKRLYLVSAVRLLIIPIVTILIFAVLPVPYMIKITMLIAGTAPVGANVAVYVQLYDEDYVYACQTVTQSTLFSILALPAVIWMAGSGGRFVLSQPPSHLQNLHFYYILTVDQLCSILQHVCPACFDSTSDKNTDDTHVR